MNFDLDEKYLAIQKEALQLAQSIENIAFEADASNEMHPGVLEAFRASSLNELTTSTPAGEPDCGRETGLRFSPAMV